MALNVPSRKHDDAERKKIADKYFQELLAIFPDMAGKRILEIGTSAGDLTARLAGDCGCEVVGIDVMSYPNWSSVQEKHPSVRLVHGDIAVDLQDIPDNYFDYIVSFVVWEHIRHPWSALSNCQRLLKPTGKKFIRANLYRSAIASHLYSRIPDPWPHLIYSPEEIARKLKIDEIGWAFWCNKLTYQQYLFYFRRLGFYITHEKLYRNGYYKQDFYEENEKKLGLYPDWDLRTDFFEVVLEFDGESPKKPVDDPVYRYLNEPRS